MLLRSIFLPRMFEVRQKETINMQRPIFYIPFYLT